MGIAPVPAVQAALNKAGWEMGEVYLFEGNQAFAARSLTVRQELALPIEEVNVNGAAVALDHPFGASGARILTALLCELQRGEKKKDVAALYVGGEMGTAMCV